MELQKLANKPIVVIRSGPKSIVKGQSPVSCFRNAFDLLLKDVEGKVLDAQLQIPGQRLIQGLNLDLPELQLLDEDLSAWGRDECTQVT